MTLVEDLPVVSGEPRGYRLFSRQPQLMAPVRHGQLSFGSKLSSSTSG